MSDLMHFPAIGRARMVDVSAQAETTRVAIASGMLLSMAQAEGLAAGEPVWVQLLDGAAFQSELGGAV
ncbi:MAG: hypothetical protein OHK0054_05290 [Sideroxydans sp.]